MCKVMEDMRYESLQEGIEQGLKQGVEQGKKESAANTAKKMLADGIFTLEKIAEYSGLSLDEVKKLSEGKSA